MKNLRRIYVEEVKIYSHHENNIVIFFVSRKQNINKFKHYMIPKLTFLPKKELTNKITNHHLLELDIDISKKRNHNVKLQDLLFSSYS